MSFVDAQVRASVADVFAREGRRSGRTAGAALVLEQLARDVLDGSGRLGGVEALAAGRLSCADPPRLHATPKLATISPRTSRLARVAHRSRTRDAPGVEKSQELAGASLDRFERAGIRCQAKRFERSTGGDIMKAIVVSSQILLFAIAVLFAGAAAAQFPIIVPEDTFTVPPEPSPPVIIGASNCSGMQYWDVSVAGGAPTLGTYEVYAGSPINGIPLRLVGSAPVSSSGGNTTVPVDVGSLFPLIFGPTNYVFFAKEVRVTAFGTLKSGYSKELAFRDVSVLNAPTIAPAPLFECSGATGVYGHQPADKITVRDFTSGATRFVVPRAYGTYDYVGEFAPKLKASESLFAVYETCDGLSLSPRSSVEKVVPFPGRQLPRPRVARASAAAGVKSFEVKEVTNGATLRAELVRPGLPVEVVTQSCIGGGQGCRVYAPAAWREFQQGDQLNVSQELCPDSRGAAHRWSITSCYSESPTFAALPRKGEEVISLSEFASGSWVMAYVCIQTIGGSCTTWSPLGSAFDSGTINLSRALVAGDFVAVSQQVTPGCVAFQATATTVR